MNRFTRLLANFVQILFDFDVSFCSVCCFFFPFTPLHYDITQFSNLGNKKWKLYTKKHMYACI